MLASHLRFSCEFTVGNYEHTTNSVNLVVNTHTHRCGVIVHNIRVYGMCNIGVNGVPWDESGWTKSRFSRNGGVLRTQVFYLTQPHM